MGSIHLTLNIDRVDLVIAICVVVIALMAFIGLIAWFIKSGRRNRTLLRIDSKLTPQQCEYIEYLAEQVQTERKKTAKAKAESVKKTAAVSFEPSENRRAEETKAADRSVKSAEYDDDGYEEYDGPDVMEEIRKMMMSDSGNVPPLINRQPGNTAKSGRVYSREEIEDLIDD